MRAAGVLLLALVLAGCADEKEAAAPEAPSEPAAPAEPAEPAGPNTADTPRIYMAVQSDGSGTTSVIFAIDERRDGTPMNDAAIRLTPEDGKCNPQELRRYNFPIDRAQRPVFGPQEVESGVTARDLPNFMAMAVTSEMMRLGIIVNPDESQPQNVCSRKLWEQLVVNQSG